MQEILIITQITNSSQVAIATKPSFDSAQNDVTLSGVEVLSTLTTHKFKDSGIKVRENGL